MKKIRKIFALLIAMVMVLGMSTSVFAAGSNTITVDVNFKDQTYTLYKLFNATVNDARAAATDADSNSSVTTAGIAYTLIDETDHALTKEFTVTKADGTTATVKAGDWFEYVNATNHNIKVKDGVDITTELFRLWAKAYGVQTGSALTASANNDTNIKWTDLDDGYYFISTTTGSLVTVDSVAPNAIVKDKNSVPSVDKTVTGGTEAESATAAADKESNTATIGDVLTYTATIHAKQNGKNYKLVDTMENGLSLVNYQDADTSADPAVEEIKVLVQVGNTTLTAGTDYTLDTFTTGKGGTFTISLKQTYLDSLTADTDIKVIYKVQVNEDAEIASANTNTATLKYGDNQTGTSDTTETYVYKFQIVKDDNQDKILTGAKFKLYDAETNGNEIPVVKTADGKYRVALSTETSVEIEAGVPEISGLKNGTYWVEETQAPDGYNKLSGRVSVTVIAANNMATFTHEGADATTYSTGDTYKSGGLEVENQAGATLPSTGGIGTTIFYIIGAILVVGAGVVLVTRRRMNAN